MTQNEEARGRRRRARRSNRRGNERARDDARASLRDADRRPIDARAGAIDACDAWRRPATDRGASRASERATRVENDRGFGSVAPRALI